MRAALSTLLPLELFDGVQNQPDAGLPVQECGVQDQVEEIGGAPIGLVILPDVVRAALVFPTHLLLWLRAADPFSPHDPLEPVREGRDKADVQLLRLLRKNELGAVAEDHRMAWLCRVARVDIAGQEATHRMCATARWIARRKTA